MEAENYYSERNRCRNAIFTQIESPYYSQRSQITQVYFSFAPKLNSISILVAQEYTTPSEKIHVKIADFGLSKKMDLLNKEKMTGFMGTVHWMAPELFDNTPYTIKADVYSFGVFSFFHDFLYLLFESKSFLALDT